MRFLFILTMLFSARCFAVNSVNGASKTLRGFQRVNIGAGKTKQVMINLPSAAFEFFEEVSGKMKVTTGDYELWYGDSSSSKDLKMTKVKIL